MRFPPSLRLNIAANFAGKGWSVLMSIAFIPLYIHAMGAESYGLVGVFLMLTSTASILDLGFSTTLNREFARSHTIDPNPDRMRRLLRTFEIPYWGMGIAAAGCLALAAKAIADNWLQPVGLTADTVKLSLELMAVALALQWPSGLYSAGLMGLERQVVLNLLLTVFSTVKGVGSLVVLWWISPSIEAFLVWQGLINGLHALTLAVVLWHSIPSGDHPSFDWSLLQSTWRYTAGLAAISILGIVMSQFDKLILSQLLTLDQFGYYSLAWMLANSIAYLVGPVSSASFPRLVRIIADRDKGVQVLANAYHTICQAVSLLTLPVAAILIFFSHEVLQVWTSNTSLTAFTAPILSLLLVGTLLNVLVQTPFQLQVATGHTRLVVIINIVALLTMVPLTYTLTYALNAVGSALAWVVLNCGYVVICVPLIHRASLKGEFGRWFMRDFCTPIIISMTICGLSAFLKPTLSDFWTVIYILISGFAALICTFLSLPRLHRRILPEAA